jgi:pimeloyl-ACP methyl ester carboxylesterase
LPVSIIFRALSNNPGAPMTDMPPAKWPKFKSRESRQRYLAAYEAALRPWPVPYESRMVSTSYGPTHVVESGPKDAPAVILLSSLAGTATVWRPNVAALSGPFRTLAVDAIGQTGRTVGTRRLHGRRDFAKWLAEVMDGLGLAKAAIVGCSFGGFLALSQASLTPERVDRVVMISPAGTFVRLSWRFGLVMHTARIRRLVRRLLGDRRAPALSDIAPPRVPLRVEDAPWRALMGVTMAEGAKFNTIPADVLSASELRRIKAPALLLIGEYEQLYPPGPTLALARSRMPQLTAEIVPGADHIAAMAQPEAVNARILQFLEGV